MSSIEEIFNNGIGYNDRLIVKNELLTDVEVLNRYQKNGIIDLLYCRLLINMFDFQKDSYVIIKFDDDENYEEYGVNYGVDNNYFTVIYAKDKDCADDLWRQALLNNDLDDLLNSIKKDELKKSAYRKKRIIMKKELNICLKY